MIIKFDKPIPIEEAREKYNDTVKFITSTETYPGITGVEFDCEPERIFKRRAIDPKIKKQSDKILAKYEKKISRLWNKTFKEIKGTVATLQKQDKVVVTPEQKAQAKEAITDMKQGLQSEAQKRFEEAYTLGKIRGQIITKQEVDDDLTDEDYEAIEWYTENNDKFLTGFMDELGSELDSILDGEYESYEDLQDAVDEKLRDSKKARALMYALAALGLVVAGTTRAVTEADEAQGHFKPEGGIWTVHPDEGKGGEICPGCLDNAGKFFTNDEFEEEYQSNDCLTNCRCDLDRG